MNRFRLTRLPLLLALLVLGPLALNGCAAGDPNIAGARMAITQGDFDRALALTDAALQENPNNAEAYRVRGDAYRAMADRATPGTDRTQMIDNMMAAYERARELDPGDQLIQLTLMQAYGAEMNRGAEAYQQASEDPTQFLTAARAFGNAGRIMPDSTIAHFYQGVALLQAGETSAAAQPLQRAVDLRIDEADAYLYLGQIYLTEDRADDAIRVLEAARDRFPGERAITTELLNTYARTGQIDRALTAYARAVQENPDDAVIRYNYGSFLLHARRYDEAEQHLQTAIRLAPESGNAHYNLGATYMNQAVELHEQWSELDDQTTQEAAQLQIQRDALLQQAVEPLEQARALFQRDGDDVVDVCRSLFRAYALLRMDAEARRAAECAGIDLD